MKRYICFILFACLLGYSAVGQTLTVNAPNVVSMDETFRVVFTANGNISDFQWEPTGDFEIVWGPQTGRMSNTTIVNGKRESSHTETYTYLLQPVREGRFTIPGATATVSKNKCNSGSFTIEVVKAQESQNASSGAATGAADSRSNNAAATGTVAKDDLFLKLTVSKTSVVKGEPISATLKL
ncbi:MAG: BatD family protein, partial [Bacteroidales bacterium]|nr:BatD family protein [Bacteroidales bacterium]